MRRKAYVGIAAAAAILICAAVLIHMVRAQSFMAEAGRMAESLLAEKLGTAVHIVRWRSVLCMNWHWMML